MWLDNASDIDILFYSPYAATVASTICDKNNTPLTVGLFGKWGAGKSTLVNLIKQELKEKKDECIVVDINAWLFEGYADAKTSLMEIITTELEKEEHAKDRIADKIKQLWHRIDKIKLAKSLFSLGGNLMATYAAPNTLSIEGAAQAMNGVAEAVSGEEIKDDITISILEFREDFADLISALDGRVVVFVIDDLDRCTPERIIDTLEAIKLFLSVPGTTFLVAADDKVIEWAISHKYPELMSVENQYAREYIEKIIQLPITIPELSEKDVMNYLMLLVVQSYLKPGHFIQYLNRIKEQKLHVRDTCITCEEMSQMLGNLSEQPFRSLETDVETVRKNLKIIDGIRPIIAKSLHGNPRQAKRFLNAFMMKRKLAELYYPDEIDIMVLAKVMALYQISPVAFGQLYEWNCSFNGTIPNLKDALDINGTEKTYAEWRTDAVQKWSYCPPIDIEAYPLDRYFYLTRENLKTGEKESALTTEAKSILANMQKVNAGTVDRIFVDIERLSESQTSILISTFITEMTGKSSDWIIASKLMDDYPERIPELLAKIKGMEIKMDSLPFFKHLLACNEQAFTEIYNGRQEKEKKILDKAKEKGKK